MNFFLTPAFTLLSCCLPKDWYSPMSTDVRKLLTMLIVQACLLHLLPICWSFDEKLFFIRTDLSHLPFTHLFIHSSSTKRNLVIGSAFLLAIVYMWNLGVTFESYILIPQPSCHSIHVLLPPQPLYIPLLFPASDTINLLHVLTPFLLVHYGDNLVGIILLHPFSDLFSLALKWFFFWSCHLLSAAFTHTYSQTHKYIFTHAHTYAHMHSHFLLLTSRFVKQGQGLFLSCHVNAKVLTSPVIY